MLQADINLKFKIKYTWHVFNTRLFVYALMVRKRLKINLKKWYSTVQKGRTSSSLKCGLHADKPRGGFPVVHSIPRLTKKATNGTKPTISIAEGKLHSQPRVKMTTSGWRGLQAQIRWLRHPGGRSGPTFGSWSPP